jgi:3-methyl-2-oxobutanoate hydroxymethyltransferase
MVRTTSCDAVKLEVVSRQAKLISRLAEAGVAIWAHLGLRPQSAQRLGYRTQGKTAKSALQIVTDAKRMQDAGAVAILLEAVPPEVAEAVVQATSVPVVGCGAGPACTAHVVVLQDLLGLTPHQPKFVPVMDRSLSLQDAITEYVRQIETRRYPAAEHLYSMNEGERSRLMTSS